MSPDRPRLRVALSMLTFVPGGMGGTETYARELVRTLARTDRIDVTALVSGESAGFAADVPERVLTRVSRGPAGRDHLRTIVEAGLVHRREIRRTLAEFDVVHVPFTVAVPAPPAGVPLVQTLHDVQHLDLPHLFSRERRAFRAAFYDRTARHADAVITVSEFAKARILTHLGLDPDRVFVAHNGVDTSGIVPQLGERENFLLYPARAWAHKNHERLIAGVEILRRTDPSLRLVLTGGALDTLGPLPEWVDVRGRVPTDELAALYGRARALVFPSLYEGFGMPPLEAMAAGCPVVSSDAGSLPEICGDAAVLFDPHDPADLARAVTEATLDVPGLQERGLARVQQFTWERCAEVHEDVYRFAAGR